MARADTETKILAAAAELIAERGYVATTTSSIAERAGVNEVTLVSSLREQGRHPARHGGRGRRSSTSVPAARRARSGRSEGDASEPRRDSRSAMPSPAVAWCCA